MQAPVPCIPSSLDPPEAWEALYSTALGRAGSLDKRSQYRGLPGISAPRGVQRDKEEQVIIPGCPVATAQLGQLETGGKAPDGSPWELVTAQPELLQELESGLHHTTTL